MKESYDEQHDEYLDGYGTGSCNMNDKTNKSDYVDDEGD